MDGRNDATIMAANNKKVCFVIPSLQAGGMERVMAELIDEFSGYPDTSVHVILYGIHRDVFYTLPQNIIVYKPAFTFDNRHRAYHTLKTLQFLRKQIKAIAPDTILSFGERWNSFTLLATVGTKYPVYVSDRCQPNKSLGRLHDWLRLKLYPRAAGVIAQTEKAKEVFDAMRLNKNITIIGNPIRAIAADSSVVKENIVLSVGRLISSKHHDELIKLFIKINKPGWKLVIVGDDAIKQQNMAKLQELVTSLDAQDKVVLAGKRNDVEQFYLKSKIFAFTSSSEGFPNVIGEAQSAGLPVVAFDCIAGPSDMVFTCRNGYLVPLFDYTRFQQNLAALMENAAQVQQFGAAAQQDIRAFSKKNIALEYKKTIFNQ
jgi:GalNAc-alpha-(1->4)-GalNAc-alpha-(1->3)-diNAcBac-PP-undecaprenol alpha-1,4-N-acetyl-D-galactosaminyltransferase